MGATPTSRLAQQVSASRDVGVAPTGLAPASRLQHSGECRPFCWILRIWQACRLNGVCAHAHAGAFAGMGPLPQPEIGPKCFQTVHVQGYAAGQPAHVHFGLLPGRVARPVVPFKLLRGELHGAGVRCQCGKVGCQWGVGVKVADHGDTPEQVAEKGTEVEFARCEVFAVLFDAHRGVKSDFDVPGHGGDCRQFGRLLGFKFAVLVDGFDRVPVRLMSSIFCRLKTW